MDFKEKTLFLLGFSAVLLPLVVLSSSIYEAGLFLAMFIVVQALMLFFFFGQEKPGFVEWYVFWAICAGSAYMLALLAHGGSLEMEFIGFFLFIAYIISIIIIAFKDSFTWMGLKKKKASKTNGRQLDSYVSQEDVEAFRTNDELSELIDAFEISPAPRKPTSGVAGDERFSIFKDDLLTGDADRFRDKVEPEYPAFEEQPEEKEESLEKEEDFRKDFEVEVEPEEESAPERVESHVEVFPKKTDLTQGLLDEFREGSPEYELVRMKESMESMDSGLEKLNEKIRLIGEKAILEAADKRLNELNKLPAPKGKQVFASVSGTKYHFDKNCLALKRVSKKDIVSYADSIEARRKKLKPCGLCRK